MRIRAAACELEYRLETRFRPPPPRVYRDEYYKDFARSARLFVGYLARWKALPKTNGGRDRVAVVVGPWLETAAPWHAIVVAIGLVRRGREVVLIWDDTGFPQRGLSTQQRAIARVLSYVGRALPVVRVTEQPAAIASSDQQILDSMASQNVTWASRGGDAGGAAGEQATEIREALANALPQIRGTLDQIRADLVVVPGGVFGTSGLFRLVANERGSRVATFDGPPGFGRVNVDGVAAHSTDVPRAFAALWDSDEDTKRAARKLAEEEFELRLAGRDSRSTQVVASQSAPTHDDCVLLPLNVAWDTAALGTQIYFDDAADWVLATVDEVLRIDAGPVVVRQHPAERKPNLYSRLDMAALVRERFGDDPRVHFVAADDPVNTYDLMRSARVVVPMVSTTGIEAALMGKPVVTGGSAYYSSLGFVWAPTSRDDYFECIRRGAQGELSVRPSQIERAWLCYYLTTICNPVPTDFTGHPSDFPYWVRRAPDDLFADAGVHDLLQATDQNIPISLLRHARLSQRAVGGSV